MDLKNIKTFVRVVELGSISRAAEEMNYAQSTVTSQIQLLEKELGFPLFDRIGKRISITAPGQEFLGYANEILHIMQKVDAMQGKTREMSGVLRVGVLESLMFTAILDVLPDFKRRFPRVEVQLTMGQAADMLVQLKQNQLDMVYLSGDLNTDPDLYCCYKRRERLIFVTSPFHPVARRWDVPLPDLLEYEFLVTERSGICYGRLKSLAAANEATIHHTIEIDSTVVIVDFLKRGMGVAFLPEYAVSDYLRKKELAQIQVSVPEQMYYSQILYHKSKWLAPFMEYFIHLVRQRKTDN